MDATKPGARQEADPSARRRTPRAPCPHCGANIPVKEHRCTHCGQDIVRHFWPAVWGGLLFGFLMFCAALYIITHWSRK